MVVPFRPEEVSSSDVYKRQENGQIDYSQDFFGKAANLTVSGQLNCENFAMAFGNVYTCLLYTSRCV